MKKDLELSTSELFRLLLNNKSKIVLPILVLVLATVFWIVLSGNQYIAESIISLPGMLKSDKMEMGKSEISIPVDVQSAKYIIMTYGKRNIKDDLALSKYMVNISAQEIKGSERFIKLSVRARRNAQKAIDISNKIMKYLQSSEYVNDEINMQRLKNESEIKDILKAIEATEKIEKETIKKPNGVLSLQYNPVDIYLGLITLKSKLHQLEKRNNDFENYKYVERPIISVASKNAYMKIITTIFLGFFLGFFWILVKIYLMI